MWKASLIESDKWVTSLLEDRMIISLSSCREFGKYVTKTVPVKHQTMLSIVSTETAIKLTF